jgi:hypothetical protein
MTAAPLTLRPHALRAVWQHLLGGALFVALGIHSWQLAAQGHDLLGAAVLLVGGCISLLQAYWRWQRISQGKEDISLLPDALIASGRCISWSALRGRVGIEGRNLFRVRNADKPWADREPLLDLQAFRHLDFLTIVCRVHQACGIANLPGWMPMPTAEAPSGEIIRS